jgi:transposase InsO family protein
MRFHRNAKLGLAGRRELVLAIAGGSSIRAAAATFNISPATAHRWWRRWRDASSSERRSLCCLLDRSSRPARSPRRLAPELEHAICECRRKTGWGPRLVAGTTGFAHSTVWKVLRRFGLSRPSRPAREPGNRYEWPCPGDLLHMDVSRSARFLRPGHRVTGDRTRTAAEVERRVGYDFVHAVVDDHSRLAYAEIQRRRASAHRGRLPRAGARLLLRARHPGHAGDDGQCLRLPAQPRLPRAPRRHRIRHLRTKPHRPRTNGKVERFHQTMAREWAYGLTYRSHRDRAAALPHWLEHYNTRRPHSSLGGKAPVSRVHNVCG